MSTMRDFNFDVRDSLKLPLEEDRPFLTPVFFEKEALVRYLYDSRYRCEFYSETYGGIYYDGGYISFGINKNGLIIMWLGDLDELSEKEKLYLLSHNIESDHNVASEFYDAQIDARFTEPVKEVELLVQKTKINELITQQFGFKLFKSEEKDIDRIIKECSRYKKLILNSEDDFRRMISEWNQRLVEDIDSSAVKRIITSKGIKHNRKLGTIKLLELFLQKVLCIEDDVISPYYILYDLRIWADHSGSREKLNSALKRLNIGNGNIDNYILIYQNLISKIIDFHSKLIGCLKEKSSKLSPVGYARMIEKDG